METIVSPILDKAKADEIGNIPLGGGAQFFVYVSPQNDSVKRITNWRVEFTHANPSWTGTISSKDPHAVLKTPNLSGTFTVKAWAEVAPEIAIAPIKPQPPSTDKIGCNSNCRSFVGLVADPKKPLATYWTVWDAVCTSGG